MEANDFVAKLKADGSGKDLPDLGPVLEEYRRILASLSPKDKGSFSLNVLCILCRNLEKVPKWADTVCIKLLITLSMECLRETRGLEKPDRVKTLACVYHMHKHVVKKNTSVPPEMILKLSYLPFEDKDLLKDYYKTYWNIFVERLTFIESLKTKVNITKLLPKLTEDLAKVMAIYDPIQFISTALVFLVKKLSIIFNGKELNETFKKIFETLNQSNLNKFKALTDKQGLDLYVKLSECIYVIADYSSRFKFKDSLLYQVARTCITLLGHLPDIFHCVQNFYLNAFCGILTENSDPNSVEAVFSGMLLSCENTEKLGYKSAMKKTYPFINQLLKLFIEYSVTENKWKDFTVQTQENCLKIVKLLMKNLEETEQLLKCENCTIRTGLHDALRLSFVLKHFVAVSLKNRMDITSILPLYIEVLVEQYNILEKLKQAGCNNYEKCLKKSQTDNHNTAILLNKASLYEFSIKLFDLYLKKEIETVNNELDMKNISRGFYNKAICELDYKAFNNSLSSAYFSYLFAYPDSLSTDKHMSLVIDIKAKTLKSKADLDSSGDDLDKEQLFSSLTAAVKGCEEMQFGDLKRFFRKYKFSTILKHEFEMYSRLWPSLVPVAGVWMSLLQIIETPVEWIKAEETSVLLWTLIEVILKTASVVRTVHNNHFKSVLSNIMKTLEEDKKATDLKAVYATLLLLKCEYDLADASQKYGWKISPSSCIDPEQASITRTIPTEHKALESAFKSVEMWTEILPQVKKEKLRCQRECLNIVQVYVPLLLLHGHAAHGLQLARGCCHLAGAAGDRESYVRNASIIISHAYKNDDNLRAIADTAAVHVKELLNCEDSLETAVVFLCEAAMFSLRCEAEGSAASLIQIAQYHVVNSLETNPEKNLDLAIGRLLAAQTEICKDKTGPSTLSGATGVQRHYLTAGNTACKWTSRQLNSNTIKLHTSKHSLLSAIQSKKVQFWRRARSAAGVAMAVGSALAQAQLLAAVCLTHKVTEAQSIIDNRLKHVLGLQPSNETQPSNQQKTKPSDLYLTPKPTTLETMLEAQMFKNNDLSPTSTYIEKARFRIPDFLRHSMCQCYACHMPYAAILACQVAGLEASMYYRSKDFETARVFFEGVVEIFGLIETKIFEVKKRYKDLKFEAYLVDMVEKKLRSEFSVVKIEILLEASFFELTTGNFSKCDENIIQIQELLTEIKDLYLKNELYNLVCASAVVRKSVKKTKEIGIEEEMNQLKLSPPKVDLQKTPETKAKVPPKIDKPKLVAAEELPAKNRKVIKLNLDDDEESGSVKRRPTLRSNKTKIPEPKVAQAAVEAMTPRPRSGRVKPKIVLTKDK